MLLVFIIVNINKLIQIYIIVSIYKHLYNKKKKKKITVK